MEWLRADPAARRPFRPVKWYEAGRITRTVTAQMNAGEGEIGMEQTFDDTVKLAVYRHVAATGSVSNAAATAELVGSSTAAVREAFARLRAKRVLLLEPDGETIHMAPPFSGVPTQHRVVVDGRRYFANCAWDALGVVAALRRPGTVHSECAQAHEPLELPVGVEGPPPSDWVFHCLVPAAHWWDDLVFT